VESGIQPGSVSAWASGLIFLHLCPTIRIARTSGKRVVPLSDDTEVAPSLKRDFEDGHLEVLQSDNPWAFGPRYKFLTLGKLCLLRLE
jgi:hypothetical protein